MYAREGEDQGSGESRCRPNHMADRHVARPVGHHLMSYRLNQVSNPSLDPYKYPSTGGNKNTHHILQIPLAKLSFLE
jgi:hypothetical protein